MNLTAQRPTPYVALWLAAATVLAATSAITRAPIVVPFVVISSVAIGVLAHHRSPSLRTWLATVDPRTLIAFHIVRAPIGLMFLALYARDLLPAVFALRAGIGDTIVGLLAIAAIAAWPKYPRAVRLWNVVGLIDIVLSVATAQKVLIGERDPVAIATVSTFPFPVIPFFVVPAVILTHLALIAKTRPTS